MRNKLQVLVILAVCISPCFAQEKESPNVKPRHPSSVMTGKATNLVMPPFPDCNCKFSKVNRVIINFMIDKNGKVESANAVSGHPALKSASLAAIRSSKFSASIVDGEPVQAFGAITYDFGWKNNKKRVRVLSVELKVENPE